MLKILLVDDEQIVLKGMQHVLSKLKNLCEIVGQANGGEECLDMLSSIQPDVIITDIKMPDIDGLELTRLVMEKYPHIYIIILSGHAEFQFARNALRYGAYDYLLKPCNHKDISDILIKIDGELKHKKQKGFIQQELEKCLDDSRKEVKRRKILDIILEKNDDNHDMDIAIENSRILVLSYNDKIVNAERVISIFTSTVMVQLDKKNSIELLQYKNQLIILLSDERDMKFIKEQLYLIKLQLTRMGSWVCGGISDTHCGIKGLAESYKQSNNIVRYLEFNELYEIREMLEVEKHYMTKEADFDPRLYDENGIIKNVFLGETCVLEKKINQMIKAFTQNNTLFNPYQVRTQIKKFMIIIEKKLKEKDIDFCMIFDRPVECIYEIEKINSYKQLLYWLKNMLMTICSHIRENQSHLPKSIQQAVQYIDNNYHEDISMKQMADLVYLNPWYFSDLFKEKLDITFSDYLTNVRINKAKELLKDTSLKNYEIAEKVGFRNSTYFNVVFKKVEGVTPKVYRKLLG